MSAEPGERMASAKVNVLSLPAQGRCTLSERGGTVRLRASDPISALQAIANQAQIKIDLTPEEVARLTGAGKFDIALSYASGFPGASEAAKQIDRMTAEAFVTRDLHGRRKRAGWRLAGLLLLLALAGAVVFIATVAVLDMTHGSRTMTQMWRE